MTHRIKTSWDGLTTHALLRFVRAELVGGAWRRTVERWQSVEPVAWDAYDFTRQRHEYDYLGGVAREYTDVAWHAYRKAFYTVVECQRLGGYGLWRDTPLGDVLAERDAVLVARWEAAEEGGEVPSRAIYELPLPDPAVCRPLLDDDSFEAACRRVNRGKGSMRFHQRFEREDPLLAQERKRLLARGYDDAINYGAKHNESDHANYEVGQLTAGLIDAYDRARFRLWRSCFGRLRL